jgi:glycosyltransferase involved in cell wall biosynthesis
MMNNDKLFFSIITPLKIEDKNLKKTINSLKSQIYKNFEHIIVISSGSKKIPSYLQKIKVKNSKIIIGKDEGIYDGINKGLKIARGDIIGTLNAGDTYRKNGLKIINNYFINNKLDFVFGTVKKGKIKHGYFPNKMFWSFNFYPAHSSGFFITKRAQNKIGLYDLDFKCSSDYDLFYKMIVRYNMKGKATKKQEVIGNFMLGGYSQKITMFEHIIEEARIRIKNKQNIIYVFILSSLRLIKNFHQLGLGKIFK